MNATTTMHARHEVLALRRCWRTVFQAILAVTVLLAVSDVHGRDKTDRIVFQNGDRVTGEIVELSNGRLRVKTDTMGTVSIEWIEIASIASTYPFAFELIDGTRYYGVPSVGAVPESVTVTEGETEHQLPGNRIVRLHPFERDFISRLSGSLSFGLNATKASNSAQFSFDAETTYQSRDSEITLDASAISSRSDEDQMVWRVDSSLQRLLYRGNRWFDIGLVSLERNDEFNLDSRINFAVGRGRFLVQTLNSELTMFGGVQANVEYLANDVDSKRNVEGVIATSYKRYIFEDPTLDLTVGLRAYPSLSDTGRVRAEFDARMRYELVNDLFVDLRIFESYDSDPPAGEGAANDYGIVTSIGWSY